MTPARILFLAVFSLLFCSGDRKCVLAAEAEAADLRHFLKMIETRNYSLGQPERAKNESFFHVE